jgi:hypothetical protein
MGPKNEDHSDHRDATDQGPDQKRDEQVPA